jgi:alcohol dehydrogenase (NADP+)
MNPDKVSHFVELQLKALQLSYIDLYLIHAPVGFKYISDTELVPKHSDGKVILDTTTDHVAIWKAMEKEVDSGRIKSLGVSNFNPRQIERILNVARIPLVNIQVRKINQFIALNKVSVQ